MALPDYRQDATVSPSSKKQLGKAEFSQPPFKSAFSEKGEFHCSQFRHYPVRPPLFVKIAEHSLLIASC